MQAKIVLGALGKKRKGRFQSQPGTPYPNMKHRRKDNIQKGLYCVYFLFATDIYYCSTNFLISFQRCAAVTIFTILVKNVSMIMFSY